MVTAHTHGCSYTQLPAFCSVSVMCGASGAKQQIAGLNSLRLAAAGQPQKTSVSREGPPRGPCAMDLGPNPEACSSYMTGTAACKHP